MAALSGPVIGIDLGTSNSVVAVVQDGRSVVLADPQGRKVHPSSVFFHENGSVLVGEKAKQRRVIDPTHTVFSAKRLIGRRFSSAEVVQSINRIPYRITEGPNEQPLISAHGRTYTVPEISACILRHLRAIAEGQLGTEVHKAVITVPANFNDAQREATRSAGRLAGLEVLRILNEPTAAALAYGYGRELDRKIAIYDFGGGTFDVTILQLRNHIFEVLATAGDSFLGGDDIDTRLVEAMSQAFLRLHQLDLRGNEVALQRLRSIAEQVKCQLSSHEKAVVQVQEIAQDKRGRTVDLLFSLTRQGLHQKVVDIVDRTFTVCNDALQLAGLTPADIHEVVLVGGTTRMPLVRQRVASYFARPPHDEINPDEVVALGAALQGDALMNDLGYGASSRPRALLLDVTPRALGIGTVGGFAEVIVARNAPIPTEHMRTFTTSQDNQTTVRIKVCQGESRRFADNVPLGELMLEGLPQRPRGSLAILVTFEVDTDGILRVHAIDQATGRAQQARIQIPGIMTDAEVEALRKVSLERTLNAPIDPEDDNLPARRPGTGHANV